MWDVIESLSADWQKRLKDVKNYSHSIRASEYHITNACNIRCQGCWFFEHEFDKPGKHSDRENTDLDRLREFVDKEKDRGINTALLIGGEPSLFKDRIRVYQERMDHVTISTNGLIYLPYEEFQDVNVAISIFGGVDSDDEMRGFRPNGAKFSGLFDKALANYENDDRAIFIYAVAPDRVEEVIPTVERIVSNGNIVNFNYYHDYSSDTFFSDKVGDLEQACLEAERRWPNQVASHPYFIKTLLSGQSHFGTFGYETCPSISVDYPGHEERLRNGNKYLPMFNTYAADLETVLFCCTSGDCDSCRDSQAVFSWLVCNPEEFADSVENMKTWIELAESYWSQFTWSHYSLYRRSKIAA